MVVEVMMKMNRKRSRTTKTSTKMVMGGNRIGGRLFFLFFLYFYANYSAVAATKLMRGPCVGKQKIEVPLLRTW